MATYALFVQVQGNAEHWTERLSQEGRVMVYLNPDLQPAEKRNFMNWLRSQERAFEEVTLIGRFEAWDKLSQRIGANGPELLKTLGDNPLVDSVAIRIAPEYLDPIKFRPLLLAIEAQVAVEGVDYDQAWIDRLVNLIATFKQVGLGLMLLVLTAVTLIIANTVRLTVMARRDEILIQRLLGAHDSFIRRPFMIEGVLQGLLGTTLALLLVLAFHPLLGGAVAGIAEVIQMDLEWNGLSATQAMTTWGLGALLGGIGAWISLARILSRSDAELASGVDQ